VAELMGVAEKEDDDVPARELTRSCAPPPPTELALTFRPRSYLQADPMDVCSAKSRVASSGYF
jgi:hypothetical protein